MKTVLIALSVIFGIATLIVSLYVTNYNYGNRAEKDLIAQYKVMESVLSSYSNQIAEASQVPEMYKNDLKEVVTSAMQARMGKGGSKAVFQWFKEQNINLAPELYKKIMTMIEVGRNKFDNEQQRFIDKKRAYETNLGYLVKGFFLRLAGFPKINLDEYVIISNDYASTAFKTKRSESINLR